MLFSHLDFPFIIIFDDPLKLLPVVVVHLLPSLYVKLYNNYLLLILYDYMMICSSYLLDIFSWVIWHRGAMNIFILI